MCGLADGVLCLSAQKRTVMLSTSIFAMSSSFLSSVTLGICLVKCMSLSTVVLYKPTGISTSPMEMEPLCATAMIIPSFFLGLVSVIWAFSFRSC